MLGVWRYVGVSFFRYEFMLGVPSKRGGVYGLVFLAWKGNQKAGSMLNT